VPEAKSKIFPPQVKAVFIAIIPYDYHDVLSGVKA
jgi:hypothetical protein